MFLKRDPIFEVLQKYDLINVDVFYLQRVRGTKFCNEHLLEWSSRVQLSLSYFFPELSVKSVLCRTYFFLCYTYIIHNVLIHY